MGVRFRELVGLVLGGAASLITVIVGIVVLALSKTVIVLVKTTCLPLVLAASLIYPDGRGLRQRIVEDVQDWWRLTEVSL